MNLLFFLKEKQEESHWFYYGKLEVNAVFTYTTLQFTAGYV